MELEQIWFVVIAAFFVGYFVLEGFDFGVGMLLPVLGRTDVRKRVLLNTIGPVWDGNEVWLITAGGALFAAFPGWYATMFSAFYIPLLLILVALIFRAVAIEFRGKIDSPAWRRRWDAAITLGSWAPAFLWGLIFADVVRGLPIDATGDVHLAVSDVVSGYGLLGGVTTALLFALHGSVFIALKSAGEVRDDAVVLARRLAVPAVLVAGVFAVWTQLAYGAGWTWALVVVAALALVGVVVATRAGREGVAFLLTCLAIVSAVALLFGSLFPDVLPSTIDAAYSLTVHSAASSHYTLVIMSWASAFLAPLVLIYQGWTYWVFRQRISVGHIPAPIGLPARSAGR